MMPLVDLVVAVVAVALSAVKGVLVAMVTAWAVHVCLSGLLSECLSLQKAVAWDIWYCGIVSVYNRPCLPVSDRADSQVRGHIRVSEAALLFSLWHSVHEQGP